MKLCLQLLNVTCLCDWHENGCHKRPNRFAIHLPNLLTLMVPHIHGLRTTFPVLWSFANLLWKSFNKKNPSKSWTPLKGRSAEASNHHHDNNDGSNRDDVFSRDGSVLRHYVNKLTLSGDISIRRHHSSSVPQICRHHPALEPSIHMEKLENLPLLPSFERRFWVQQQSCRSARLGGLWNCWNQLDVGSPKMTSRSHVPWAP